MKTAAQRWVVRVVLLLAGLAGAIALVPSAWADHPVSIGVLAYRDKAQTQAQWQPLASALKQAIPGWDFVVHALPQAELNLAVTGRTLDFVLTTPSNYIELTRLAGLSSPLATLANDEAGRAVTVFGGVIFTRAAQAQINTLGDIRGKTVAAVNEESLGGYRMQAYEFKKVGIDLAQEVKLVLTGPPQDRPVEEVLAGRADVGFVRTGLLEDMAREGRLDLKQVKILNKQDLPEFPVQISTRLYPEWPFAALPQTEENLARRVAAALFLLEEDTAVTRAIGIHGFVVPADYRPAENLLRELRLPPFDVTPVFALRDVWSRYRWPILAVALALGVVMTLSVGLLVTRRKLSREHGLVLRQKEELRSSEFRWKFAIEGSGAGLWDWNLADNTVFWSSRWKQTLGFADDEFGSDIAQWEERLHPEDRAGVLAALEQAFAGKTHLYVSEHRMRCRDQSYKWIRDHGSVVSRAADGKPLRMIGTISDISERKLWEQSIRQLAHFDVLTGLPNRALFTDRLQQAMLQTQRSGQTLALAYLDLDGFKSVNDLHGHDAGDHVLKLAAERMKQALREGDTLARIGGDEFVAVLLDVSDRQVCEPTLERLLAAAAQPVLFGDLVLQVSASAGLTFYPQAQDIDIEGLLRQADQAMYQAKVLGKNRYQVFEAAAAG